MLKQQENVEAKHEIEELDSLHDTNMKCPLGTGPTLLFSLSAESLNLVPY